MKKFLNFRNALTILVSAFTLTAYSQEVVDEYYMTPGPAVDACTSIMVGKKASTDGSTMTSHTCDGNYRTWAEITPAQKHKKGDVVEIYKGLLHTQYPADRTNVTISGTIPQIESTYAYFNTGYPCMNEKNLTMGETTIVGRPELYNPNSVFQIEELQKIALQRTTTARDAIKLMGQLIKEYGYSDRAECLTIADKDEVWIFEVFGEGKDAVGGVWAAVRVPDDHIAVSCNIPRIGKLDLDNKDYYMASDNVYSVGKKLGYWDGKSEFVFWKVYGGRDTNFKIRDFFILSSFAPSLNLSMDDAEMPFSVKPDKKVSVQDVIAMQKQYYEGTEYDPTKNLTVTVKDKKTGKDKTIVSPYANPWMKKEVVDMFNSQKEGAVVSERLISVPQCAYFTVIQVKDWLPEEIGAVVWYGLDNPGQSPRIPVYSGTLSLPTNIAVDGQHNFRRDAAVWPYRRANKLSSIKWGATREDIEGGVAKFEKNAQRTMPTLEAEVTELVKAGKNDEAKEVITEYVHSFTHATQQYWWELGDKFWMLFARGI